MIYQFNNLTLRELQNDLESALIAISEKHNIGLKLGHMTYTRDGDTFKTTISGYTNSTDSEIETEEIIFNKYCNNYGLLPTDYKKNFTFQNETYEIIGTAPKSTKYPILCKNSKGIVYKLTADDCCKSLQNQ